MERACYCPVDLEFAAGNRLAFAVQSTLTILRVHFREHNKSVIFASGATLLFAVIGWAFVYGAAYWFTVAFLSVKEGLHFNGTENFNRNFLSCVAVLYVATLVDRWVFRYSPEAVDRRPFSETLLDIALFLPRMTLSVFENFMVWTHLSQRQMTLAVRLAEIIRERGRYALHEMPVLIPTEKDREKILFAMRAAQVLDVRPSDGIVWLYIGSLAPTALLPAVTAVQNYRSIPTAKEGIAQAGGPPQKQLPGSLHG